MREFLPSPRAIRAEAAIDIAAPPAKVAALYRDAATWGATFSATIASARVVATGDNWIEIEVEHKQQGRVPNTLILLSDTAIGLEERKKKFDASFLNRFEPGPNGGTRFAITAYVSLRGIYAILKPVLAGYVRRQALRQMQHYVLEPMKVAAERQSSTAQAQRAEP